MARLEFHKVKSIMLPYVRGETLIYSVDPEDKLTNAVKRMLLYNTDRIAVVKNGRVIGMIYLEDALKKLGL